MPMTPGYYMPNYVSGYYPSGQPMPAVQQSYAQQQQPPQGIIWVDGEVGAKAHQLPSGWPAGVPIALWDTNDTVIYLKSINPMGMPNPLQKIHYRMDEPANAMLPAGQSGSSAKKDEMPGYVTKDDLEAMKNEIRELLKDHSPAANQNGSGNGQNNANRGAGR